MSIRNLHKLVKLHDNNRTADKVYDHVVLENREATSDNSAYWQISNEPELGFSRIREVITAHDPASNVPSESTQLKDNDPIPIEGTAGDGNADSMPYLVTIDGVEESEIANYFFRILVNGQESQEVVNLSSATKLDDFTWQLKGTATFSTDFNEDSNEVEFRVDLHEGGFSKQTINFSSPSAWTLLFGGAQLAGQYDGEYSIIGSSSSTTQLIMLIDEPLFSAPAEAGDQVSIDINIFTPLSDIELNTPIEADQMTIQFSELTSNGATRLTSLLRVGGGTDESPVLVLVEEPATLFDLPVLEEFLPPAAPLLSLSSIDRDAGHAIGTVTGDLYACHYGDPSSPAAAVFVGEENHFCNTYSINLSFKAKFP